MDKLYFGTGGAPHSAKSPSSQDGVVRLAELGLECMELEFVQGVRMGDKTAEAVRMEAEKQGIILTVHAPYYINFNAKEAEKVSAARERLLQSARVGARCGAVSVAFHAAFYLGDPPKEVYVRLREHLKEITHILRSEGNQIAIRPELMGKPTQFGDIEEVLELSREVEGVAPCVDIAHYHARTGGNNSYQEFTALLERIREVLGPAALTNMHFHAEGIEYNKTGERRHLMLEDSDFRYQEFLQALKDYEVKGIVICESPDMEKDALLIQRTYQSL